MRFSFQIGMTLTAVVAMGSGCPTTSANNGSDAGPGSNGGTTIKLAANPTAYQIGDTAGITLTASGTDTGQAWEDGNTVTFITNWGTLVNPQTNLGTAVQNNEVTISGHQAVTTLYTDPNNPVPPTNPTNPGQVIPATVTAQYVDTSGDQVTATVNITITTATVESLAFTCDSYNIGTFDDQEADTEIKCTVQAYDANANLVQGAQIKFLAEAGAVIYDDEYQTYAYEPFTTGAGNVPGANGLPVDVAPLPNPSDSNCVADMDCCEPSYVDTSSAMSPTRNPRDGLTTIVAYVVADPAAIATAGLSYAPYGGTPFIDYDDTGAYHTGDPIAPEVSSYQSSQTTYLWKQIKILWTGALQTTPNNDAVPWATWDGESAANSSANVLEYPGTATLCWDLLDQNLNILAANDPSTDIINWECSGEGVEAQMETSPIGTGSSQRLGMSMDSNFNFTTNVQTGCPDFTVGGTACLPIINDSVCQSGGSSSLTSMSCYGSLDRSLWIDATGEPEGEISEENTEAINGEVEPQPPTCSSG